MSSLHVITAVYAAHMATRRLFDVSVHPSAVDLHAAAYELEKAALSVRMAIAEMERKK